MRIPQPWLSYESEKDLLDREIAHANSGLEMLARWGLRIPSEVAKISAELAQSRARLARIQSYYGKL